MSDEGSIILCELPLRNHSLGFECLMSGVTYPGFFFLKPRKRIAVIFQYNAVSFEMRKYHLLHLPVCSREHRRKHNLCDVLTMNVAKCGFEL